MKMKKIFVTIIAAIFLAMSIVGCTEQPEEPKEVEAPIEVEAPKTERNKIVVISDLHLGIEDDYTETYENRTYLIEFLEYLQAKEDVRELVIAGDFLDEWYLPVYYPSYTDEVEFYKQVIENNSEVIDAFNKVTEKGIKLVYVPGNHDMTLEAEVLQTAIPKIVQARDSKGLGVYYTGDRNEIVVEHGHRYDVFSAPDTITNAALCGNENTILPAGYFYARYAATWVLEGRPQVDKDLPVVAQEDVQQNIDQYGAYYYYKLLDTISKRMTPEEALEKDIFDIRIAGFNDKYSYLDFFPCMQADGTISAPTLYRNIQRTWADRQEINGVKVKNDFLTAVAGTVDWSYYEAQAKAQYIDNPDEDVDIVVFGHTHVPALKSYENGTYYVNSGTWVDHNTDFPKATRTFTVITTGTKDAVELYSYTKSGNLWDISGLVNE